MEAGKKGSDGEEASGAGEETVMCSEVVGEALTYARNYTLVTNLDAARACYYRLVLQPLHLGNFIGLCRNLGRFFPSLGKALPTLPTLTASH